MAPNISRTLVFLFILSLKCGGVFCAFEGIVDQKRALDVVVEEFVPPPSASTSKKNVVAGTGAKAGDEAGATPSSSSSSTLEEFIPPVVSTTTKSLRDAVSAATATATSFTRNAFDNLVEYYLPSSAIESSPASPASPSTDASPTLLPKPKPSHTQVIPVLQDMVDSKPSSSTAGKSLQQKPLEAMKQRAAQVKKSKPAPTAPVLEEMVGQKRALEAAVEEFVPPPGASPSVSKEDQVADAGAAAAAAASSGSSTLEAFIPSKPVRDSGISMALPHSSTNNAIRSNSAKQSSYEEMISPQPSVKSDSKNEVKTTSSTPSGEVVAKKPVFEEMVSSTPVVAAVTTPSEVKTTSSTPSGEVVAKKPVFEEMVSSTPVVAAVTTPSEVKTTSSTPSGEVVAKKPVFEEMVSLAPSMTRRADDNVLAGAHSASNGDDFASSSEKVDSAVDTVPEVSLEKTNAVVDTTPAVVSEKTEAAVDTVPEVSPEKTEAAVDTVPEVSPEKTEAAVDTVPEVSPEKTNAAVDTTPAVVSEKTDAAVDTTPAVVSEKTEATVDTVPEVSPDKTEASPSTMEGSLLIVPKGEQDSSGLAAKQLDEELGDSFAEQNNALVMAGGGVLVLLLVFICAKKCGGGEAAIKESGYAPVSATENDYAGRGVDTDNVDLEAGGGIELTVADDGNDSWDDDSDSDFNSGYHNAPTSPIIKAPVLTSAPPRPQSVSPLQPPVLGTSKSSGSSGSLSSKGSFSSAPRSNSSSSSLPTKASKAKASSKYPPLNSTTDDIFASIGIEAAPTFNNKTKAMPVSKKPTAGSGSRVSTSTSGSTSSLSLKMEDEDVAADEGDWGDDCDFSD